MEPFPTEISAPEYVPISAWLGHGPFAIWLVKQMKPATIVELGTHFGFSYFCFCQAVRESALDTRCFAVDTWEGDVHAGFYGDDVYQAVKAENQKYEHFSTLVRKNFFDAASEFKDGSIDLLHVDGRHFYEDVKQDFETWIPKLSRKAVVLFHDTEVRGRNFGAWKYWDEISRDRPSINFLHQHGLGVLFWGPETTDALQPLLRMLETENGRASVISLFAQRGEAVSALAIVPDAVDEPNTQQSVTAAPKLQDKTEPRRQDNSFNAGKSPTLWRRAAFHRNGRPRGWLRKLVFKDEKQGKVRGFARRIAFKKNGIIRPEFDRMPARILPIKTPVDVRNGKPHVVLISGEPIDRAGFRYRVADYAEAFRALGFSIAVVPIDKILENIDEIRTAEILYVWRASLSAKIEEAFNVANNSGAVIIYDIDDLIFRPELTNEQYMDAIRFNTLNVDSSARHSARVLLALVQSDIATATTAELADHMRAVHPNAPVFVNPNGYTEDIYAKARTGSRAVQRNSDGCLRIGYAAGTRTHQADFKLCAGAVADYLRANGQARLVLFSRDGSPMLDPVEFPELADLKNQIEWRPFVPLSELPFEMARFDINLAPLEFGNPFCEGKSELKFFEAAIADVPTIASPTGPFRRAIENGKTGLLASSPNEWREALSVLTEKEVRDRIGRAAHRSVLWPFGPMNRAERLHFMLEQMAGGRRAMRARQFAAIQQAGSSKEFKFVPHLLSFEHCTSRPSRVTVAMPLMEKRHEFIDALESVSSQTIADLDLLLVDDGTQSASHEAIADWLERNKDRFNRAIFIKHEVIAESSAALNAAFDHADTLHVLVVAPNFRLDPECCANMLAAAAQTATAVSGHSINADRNAVALISKEAWALSGGFDEITPDIGAMLRNLEARGLHIDKIPGTACRWP